MDRSYIPLTKFYESCLPVARSNGYKYAVCLLARDIGIDGLYDSLKQQWFAIDDLTGKDFLFMFAGKYMEDDRHSEIWHKVSQGGDYVLRNEYLHILNSEPSLSLEVSYDTRGREERGRFTPDLPRNHTRAISGLRRLFGLSESQIPCIVFTNLFNGKNMVVPFHANSIYDYLRETYIALEPVLREIDNTAATWNLEKDLDLRDETHTVKKINYLRNKLQQLTLTLPDEDGERLRRCIEYKEYGKFPSNIRSLLNKYVDLSRNNAVTAEAIDLLNSLYNKVDEIIAHSAANPIKHSEFLAPTFRSGDNSVQIGCVADGGVVNNHFYIQRSDNQPDVFTEKLKAILLDDDIFLARSYSGCLNDTGVFDCDYATTVDEMFKMAERDEYDVFILDISINRGKRYTVAETADGWTTGLSVYTELKDKYPCSVVVALSNNFLPQIVEWFDREDSRLFAKRDYSPERFPEALLSFIAETDFRDEDWSEMLSKVRNFG